MNSLLPTNFIYLTNNLSFIFPKIKSKKEIFKPPVLKRVGGDPAGNDGIY